ncbi:hypothetical protein EAH_00066510 [Eimeria acervulina]|uniref:Uncharacterized protein n=1 Tax=Eimeria acervulina TaxID=5801 RepID=U6GQI5_EIMAC|nr:hypothetical protein EAH_00066510 [Eimeria acervulina]CDI82460.1 hypothetical protein EAH_00066510 [Eimeria acervulina]
MLAIIVDGESADSEPPDASEVEYLQPNETEGESVLERWGYLSAKCTKANNLGAKGNPNILGYKFISK